MPLQNLSREVFLYVQTSAKTSLDNAGYLEQTDDFVSGNIGDMGPFAINGNHVMLTKGIQPQIS